jgi:hypothetical protein
MSRLVEDFLTQEERAAISDVLESRVLRFDELVRMAGLNPREDLKYSNLRNLNFCGADLRGFDFSGSDLAGCVTDDRTIIDETTILHNAAVNWITLKEAPIVTLMQKVQTASAPKDRQSALEELETKFGKTDHVISFVVNAAVEAESIQEYLDYTEFLPNKLTKQHRQKLIEAGVRVLSRKFGRSRSRTKREATTIFAASTIADRLANSEDSFAAEWYASLAGVVDTNPINNALQGTTARIVKDDLLAALNRLAER